MLRCLLLLSACWGLMCARSSAQTILNFESPATSTTFQYFGSSIDGQLTKTVPNPNVSGGNSSATVMEFKKPAGAQTWAGGFSNPNPTTSVNVVTNTKITIKVHFDHIGNLTLKLENSATGGPNWVQTVANTKVNEWETLTFNVALPSIEAPSLPALGHIYKTVTLFTDFGVSPTADQVSYIDDIRVEESIVCTTILNFEAPATSTTFQYFGSTLDGQLTKTVANPNKSGIDTSATVLEFKKPANSQTWAGAYSNPNASKPINLLIGGKIKIKFHTDHPGNLVLKLEEAQDGAPNWALKVPVGITELNKWVELVFDPALPSIEGPNQPATGHVYNKVVLFADFDVTFTTDQVYYIDDLEVCTSGSIPTGDVVFKVDMKQYSGSYSKVYVSGSFNGWAGDKNELLDPDGDKIYEAKINLPVGLYEYKFTLDNWAQQEQLSPTSTCTNTTVDGANIFTNRKLALSGNATVGPVCYNSCYACGDAVRITVNLGMGTYVPDAGGVYLAGGGDFGPPGGRFRMTDSDGDGVFSIQVERQRGYSTFYDFANGNCPDYSCKENLAGQSCAVPTNFNDRWLPPVQQDTTINTCFASCATNTACTSGTRDALLSSDWLKLQPTVTADAVQLRFATAPTGKAEVRVFNAAGQMVWAETLTSPGDAHSMSVAHLQNGVYWVWVQTEQGVANARLLKQN